MNFSVKLKKYSPILLFSAVCTLAIYIVFAAFQWEPNQFELNRHEIFLSNWSPELDDLKVVILSDIHQKRSSSEWLRTDRIVQTVNQLKPDIIFLLGDYLGDTIDPCKRNALPEDIARHLAPLKAKYGVFAVLGNHDWWLGGNGIKTALQNVGFRVLENELETIIINRTPLNIIGLPDYSTRKQYFNPDNLPSPSIPAIVLSHDPVMFNKSDLPYELMLAGHTHGGQVKLPIIGAAIAYSSLFSSYSDGFYKKDGKTLFVTRGVGTSLVKMRLNCMPEIVLLSLKQK